MIKNLICLSLAIVMYSFGFSQKNTITLSYQNNDSTLDSSIENGFKKIVFHVYPQLIKDFNSKARKDLKIKIDTSYNGVAYAHDGQITVSSKWMHSHPKDLDLMTHEIMHIIQSYPGGSGPGWLTEGIADYVRFKYGLNNKEAGWSLTPFNKNQHYSNSYRITARFLEWIRQKYDKKIIVKLDEHLRNQTYSEDLWKTYTGKDLDELWEIYSSNPSIST
ncbi:basic secretory protein-like protein [Leeuwenhoekiella aequorea]|uniref:Basic secretory peptidase family protein n=1 Tax=Leeuwenhoekiella aequorea TaxID=283736 RepID=A0A4Q0P4G8_9FLAO|nr:basic secretory protein-like protein [Leeuwenhoekiella aequorea]RXG21235.1 basic secretory peptidase family protein [Leeuwenhoekiella aequorea]